MMPIDLNEEKLAQLVKQADEEYRHALKYREKREESWQTVDELYYGKKKKSLITRSVIHIPKMTGNIDTFVSKIDHNLYINYQPVNETGQLKAKKMNHYLKYTMNKNQWNFYDLMGKKEAALYGRCIYKKFATSEKGYSDYFILLDTLDFLIDPLAGGINPFDKAMYCGQDNIIKTVHDLDDKDYYDQEAVQAMAAEMNSDRDVDNRYQSKAIRRSALNLSEAVMIQQKSIRLVEWYTHFEGQKWIVLYSPEHKKAVRAKKLKDVFEHDEFPFASWAPFPRVSEFWTPGLGEMLSEPNKVQNIIISQLLDNNAYRNYGMKAFDTNRVLDPKSLTPRPNGKVPVNGNPREAIMDIPFPSLDNGLAMYNTIDQIWAKETGVTENAQGMPVSKRMTSREFVGLLDAVEDRFMTSNKSYQFAMERIALIFQSNVKQFMSKAVELKIMGPSGYDTVKMFRSDADCEFDVSVVSGIEEEQNEAGLFNRLVEFQVANQNNPRINQRFLDERIAKASKAFTPEEIERLLSPDLEGDWQTISEAAIENELLLEKEVDPNKSATAAHVQKHLDFISKQGSLTPEQRTRIMRHAESEMEYVTENEERKVENMLPQAEAIAENMNPAAPAMPEMGQPVVQGSRPAPQPMGQEPPINPELI